MQGYIKLVVGQKGVKKCPLREPRGVGNCSTEWLRHPFLNGGEHTMRGSLWRLGNGESCLMSTMLSGVDQWVGYSPFGGVALLFTCSVDASDVLTSGSVDADMTTFVSMCDSLYIEC